MSVFTHWQFSPLHAETIKIAHRQIPTLHAWRPEGHKELFLDKDSSDVTIIFYMMKVFWTSPRPLIVTRTYLVAKVRSLRLCLLATQRLNLLLEKFKSPMYLLKGWKCSWDMYMYFSHVSKEKINSDLMMAAKQLQCRGACQ